MVHKRVRKIHKIHFVNSIKILLFRIIGVIIVYTKGIEMDPVFTRRRLTTTKLNKTTSRMLNFPGSGHAENAAYQMERR